MKILKKIAILALMVAMVSCSGVKIVVDSNENLDFSAYKTCNFLSWQNVSDEMFDDNDKKLLRDSFIKEFERRGISSVSGKGDMQVSLYLVTSNETAFSGYNDYVGGKSSDYSHYRGSWGYGYAPGNTSKQQSKLMGTLIMNVYDRSNKQVWQAIATSAVVETYEKREKSIPAKVSTIMKKFPVKPK